MIAKTSAQGACQSDAEEEVFGRAPARENVCKRYEKERVQQGNAQDDCGSRKGDLNRVVNEPIAVCLARV